MVRIKPPNYTPIGDELSGNSALLQAAAALDAAVFFAVESRDSSKLMEATTMWIDLAGRLGVVLTDDEDEEEDEKKGHKFGFNNSEKEVVDEGN